MLQKARRTNNMKEYKLTYKLTFYKPAFIDFDQPEEFYFKTKEELLNHPELKRVSKLDGHARFEQITKEKNNRRSTLMHIYDNNSFWVKAFIEPNLDEQWFNEWKYENYKGDK